MFSNKKRVFALLYILFLIFSFLNLPHVHADDAVTLSKCDDLGTLPASCWVANSRKVNVYIAGPNTLSTPQIRIGETSDLSSKSFSKLLYPQPYTFSDGGGMKTVYVDYKDPSSGTIYHGSQTFTVDLSAPYGDLSFDPSTIQDVPTVKMTVTYEDYYDDNGEFPSSPIRSGSVSICTHSDMANCYWETISNGILSRDVTVDVDSVAWGTMGSYTYYFRFRDDAGNTSEIYSSSVAIDRFPPSITAYRDQSSGKIIINSFDERGSVSKIYYSKDTYSLSQFLRYPDEFKDKVSVINNPRSEESITITSTGPNDYVAGFVAEDAVGNRSDIYYTAIIGSITVTQPPATPKPSALPTETISVSTTASPSITVTTTVTAVPSTTDTIINGDKKVTSDNSTSKHNDSATLPVLPIIGSIIVVLAVGGGIFFKLRARKLLKKVAPEKA